MHIQKPLIFISGMMADADRTMDAESENVKDSNDGYEQKRFQLQYVNTDNYQIICYCYAIVDFNQKRINFILR